MFRFHSSTQAGIRKSFPEQHIRKPERSFRLMAVKEGNTDRPGLLKTIFPSAPRSESASFANHGMRQAI